MIPFNTVIVPLSAALGLSVAIERILEFLKNIFEPFIGTKNMRALPKAREKNQKLTELEKITKNSEGAEGKELNEQSAHTPVLVDPANDPDDGETIRAFIIQLSGFALGIILARIFNITLFRLFLQNSSVVIQPWMDFLLTGLLIGGGSAPVHMLIRFITQRKVIARSDEAAVSEKNISEQEVKLCAPALISASAIAAGNWADIPYNGGIDIELLENVHRRDKEPSMIIYHHTAMSSRSTFEDVVKVIKSNTDSYGNHWYTGYNCVILFDGSIKPFCRWDRYGTHAAGYNNISLGISFNGNFETDPKVPCSNASGNYGPCRPSEVQLEAGARVVALWTFLYPVKPDFSKSILPHKNFSTKTCPGSQFPYDKFRKLVEFYRNSWEKSSYAKERIAEFKFKPYLYKEKKEA